MKHAIPEENPLTFISLQVMLAALACLLATPAGAQVIGGPTLYVTNGLFEGSDRYQPLLFSWSSRVRLAGDQWTPNATLTVHLYGPLNTPGVTPTDRVLGPVYTDAQGRIAPGIDYDPVVEIPFDDGAPGTPHVTRPGLYLVRINLDRFGLRHAQVQINICPRTAPFYAFPLPSGYVDWARSRGARDGILGDYSPERTDPEWSSVWSETPIAVYGTITTTGTEGANQTSIISHEDFPSWHYAHDADLFLELDPEYRWALSEVAFGHELDDHEYGRLELEWETQNAGRPTADSYGTGDIGVPLWAMPTVGDRVFTVGRWILDNGHPPAHTEIHPMRLLATMRSRASVVSAGPLCSPVGAAPPMMRATQVDVFVSGHGGAANQFPDGLSAALDSGGLGGGRIEQVLGYQDFIRYEDAGPADTSTIAYLGLFLAGYNPDLIRPDAGPSAFGWTMRQDEEERPIDDMDYDFDVRLAPPPAGATAVRVEVTTHPEHTTAVNEVITYGNPDPTNGLPTTAHVHLPYRGAGNGVYARTLKFSWNTFDAPGRHFVVSLTRLDFFQPEYMTAREFMWADVAGQWQYLTGLAPDRFLNARSAGIELGDAATFHVYLDPADALRLFVQGYDAGPFDELMGIRAGVNQTSRPAYDTADQLASIALDSLVSLNPPPHYGDSEDLLGSVWEGPPIPTLPAAGGIRGDHFSVGPYVVTYFHVGYVPNPHVQVAPVNFGTVCRGYQADAVARIGNSAVPIGNGDPYTNAGVDTLTVDLALSGPNVSLVPATFPHTFSVDAGQHQDVPLRFAASSLGQVVGLLTVHSNDTCRPAVVVPLRARVRFPLARLTGATKFGRVPVNDNAPGHSRVLPVSVDNLGSCAVTVSSAAVVAGDAADFHVLSPPALPASIPPGGHLLLPVEFNPTRHGYRSATLRVLVQGVPPLSSHLTGRGTGRQPPGPHLAGGPGMRGPPTAKRPE